jgi:hypothetical protein
MARKTDKPMLENKNTLSCQGQIGLEWTVRQILLFGVFGIPHRLLPRLFVVDLLA